MRGKSIRLPEPGGFLKRMISGLSVRRDEIELLQHELRTPLTGILGMASLLQESRLHGEQLQLLNALEQSARQLADLLEHSGAWFKTGTVKVPVNARTFNGLHLLENLIRAHWPAARRNSLGLFLVFDHRLPAFWRTDPVLLQEALDNLLANAIKFTPSGYVVLEARRSGGEAGTAVELRVIDTGVGIPRSDERRIYLLGERGSEDRVRQHSGSGYGLFMCDRIAAALGGSLNHSRTRSGGTRFTMRLPGAVVAVPGATERLRPRLLRGLRCEVSLPQPLDRVVAHALRRMGISVIFQKGDGCEGWPQQQDARITGSLSGFEGFPVLQGRPADCDSRGLSRTSASLQRKVSWVLHEPVLHANLEPRMLQLALHLRLNSQ